MKHILSISFAIALTLAPFAYAQQRRLKLEVPKSEQRVALVMGNGAYEVAPLKNPVNDALDLAQALREIGFDVIYEENLTQNHMKRAIRDFGDKIRNGGIGLFYYAGHGVQVKGINYLVPVDAKVESEEEVEYECVDAGFVLAQMESARNNMNIVILDACRNNPFARSFRSGSRGLAPLDAPSGTLIAYATAPGSVASDGSARNGLYTQELLKVMRTPGLGIEEIFKRVRISVRNLTQGRQTPWESSSLIGDFYFIRTNAATKSSTVSVTNPSTDPAAVELVYWETIKDSTDPEDFEIYLQKHPSGQFAALAKNRLKTTSASVTEPGSTVPESQINGVLAPLAKVMNAAFAKEYADKPIKTKVQFIAAGQTENYIFGAIPKKVMEGKVAFRISSPDQTSNSETPFGYIPPHAFIDKAKADLVFELKKGDLIILTGSTVIGKSPMGGGQDFIQVIFVATSIERAK